MKILQLNVEYKYGNWKSLVRCSCGNEYLLGNWYFLRKTSCKQCKSRKGKTYQEIYGDRADEEALKRKLGNQETANLGLRKPAEQTEALLAVFKSLELRKGKTYQEIYGDRAEEEINKRKEAHRLRALSRREISTLKRTRHKDEFEYKDWRMAVFKRDCFTCKLCNIRGGSLNAHHIRPWSRHPEFRYIVSNGITLCKECHKQIHSLMGLFYFFPLEYLVSGSKFSIENWFMKEYKCLEKVGINYVLK